MTADDPIQELEPFGHREPGGWVRMGTLPGPRMWALGFMRIERVPYGRTEWLWRAWDCDKTGLVHKTHPTTLHRTLKAAKAHCERIIGEAA